MRFTDFRDRHALAAAWMVFGPTRVQPLGVPNERLQAIVTKTPEIFITIGKDLEEKGDVR